MTNNTQPTTSYSHLIVTMTLSCLVLRYWWCQFIGLMTFWPLLSATWPQCLVAQR